MCLVLVLVLTVRNIDSSVSVILVFQMAHNLYILDTDTKWTRAEDEYMLPTLISELSVQTSRTVDVDAP